MVEFCQKYELPYEVCGKVIVATKEQELPLLDNLYKRGLENGLQVKKYLQKKLKKKNPM
jgi:L-2-hydroxyglutarate oxidase